MYNRLLNQPEKFRRRIAYFLTIIIGFLIVSSWLMVTKHNMQQAVKPSTEEIKTAENFRQSLPSVKQEATVQTELSKQQSAKVGGIEIEKKASISIEKEVEVEEESSFWERWFGFGE